MVLSKLCRKFGFEEIKELMPEQDRKLVANMQSVAQRELKAKKARLTFEIEGAAGDRSSTGGVQGDKDDGDAARISKAFRTFDSIMQGLSHLGTGLISLARYVVALRRAF